MLSYLALFNELLADPSAQTATAAEGTVTAPTTDGQEARR